MLYKLFPFITLILLTCTLPIIDWGIVAWITLVPLFIFIRHKRTTTKQATLITATIICLYIFVTLLPLISVNVWWWGNPLLYEYRHIILALIFFFVSLYAGGLFGAFIGYTYHKTTHPLIIATLWGVLELARLPISENFVWGMIGFSQHSLPTIFLSQYIGIVGVGFLIVLVNALIADTLRTKTKQNTTLLIITIIIITVVSIGIKNNTPTTPTLQSIPLSFKEEPTPDSWRDYLPRIQKELEQEPDILLLPENSFSSIPTQTILHVFYTLSIQHPHTHIFLGIHQKENGITFNSLAHIHQGSIQDIYNKKQLLPLGEKDFFFQETYKKITPGEKTTFSIHDTILTPLICSEISQSLPEVGDIILHASNESIFDSSLIAKQIHIIATSRAIQHKTTIIHATKGNSSYIIFPNGTMQSF